MMIHRNWRYLFLPLVLLVLIGSVLFFWDRESKTCMGVPLLSEQQAATYSPMEAPISAATLTFDHQPAAVDQAQKTIYISQAVTAETKLQNLAGQLRLIDNGYRLYFAPDPQFDNLQAAMKEGHSFPLWIVRGKQYTEYKVVLSNLPILSMNGAENHTDEEGRAVYQGDFALWAAEDAEAGRRSLKTAQAEWHIRGASSSLLDKKPWKVSLKSKKGKIKDHALLGLGADDDWILNPLNMDDTDLKEKLMMELWNSLAAQSPSNEPMSNGEYVELVLNGEYQGLYLLQRRIDRKYLQLGKEDILLKGTQTHQFTPIDTSLEIVYSPLNAQETYALVEGFCNRTDYSMMDLENFKDVFLFLRFGSLTDNVGCKNMFYLLKRESDGYRMTMIPWDTDMSFGVTWINEIEYDYQVSMNAIQWRSEYWGLGRVHKTLKNKIYTRWKELRKDALSDKRIYATLDRLQAQLDAGGAQARDYARWGNRHGGMDTRAQLKQFLQERLEMLDQLQD